MRRTVFILLILLLVAACNLSTADPTPTFAPLPTVSYVAPTPYRAPTLFPTSAVVGAQAEAVTGNGTTNNLLTPVPAQTLLQNPQPSATSQNAIEAFVNNLIIPIWNFIYTFVLEGLSTLWLFAGARGGTFAQVFCCIVPAFMVVGVVLIRLRVVRLWRR